MRIDDTEIFLRIGDEIRKASVYFHAIFRSSIKNCQHIAGFLLMTDVMVGS